MSRRKKSEPRTRSSPDDSEWPIWKPEEGNLYSRGSLVMHLASHAHAERAILDKFEKLAWRFVVKNPLPRDKADISDPTSSRRHAIHNLVQHRGDGPALEFFSVGDGFVAWCPAEGLTE